MKKRAKPPASEPFTVYSLDYGSFTPTMQVEAVKVIQRKGYLQALHSTGGGFGYRRRLGEHHARSPEDALRTFITRTEKQIQEIDERRLQAMALLRRYEGGQIK